VVERYDDITTMRDLEGNELCVEPARETPTRPRDAEIL
jgi:hypothetical protein